MRSQKWRFILTSIIIVVAFMAYWDTFRLWTMSEEEKQTMQEEQPGELLELQQKAIRLGLDLQGGIHVVLRVKLEELDNAAKEGAVDRAIQIIRNRIDGLGVAEPVITKQGEDRIMIDLPGYTDEQRAQDLIGQTALLEFKLLENFDNAQLLINRIDSAIYSLEVAKEEAAKADDETAEPAKTEEVVTEDDTTGEVDVMAELMGGSDASGDTIDFGFDEAMLASADTRPFSSRIEVSLYNTRNSTNHPGFTVRKQDKPKLERWLERPEVRRLIPVDVEWLWSTRAEVRNQRDVYDLYLMKRKVVFVGKYLEGISLGRDQFGGQSVNFKLSGDGAARFAQLTGANLQKPLAIVIDGKVESAAFINSKIRNSGQITMGSSASIQNARTLEIVLKAGALPAPVEIIAKNVVGATLGHDSITKGLYSAMVGLSLVLIFIAVYYRLSGIIADIGLIFNIFFLLAVMAALGATLTMPGIAGIILTIGISVDSNILIFERIREEMRTGKTVRASIDAGYSRAFVAIFDSHVTTLITAGALFLFGSGPIKGFAVTLFWGVGISLYTAYVITKAIFDIRKGYSKLSI